jgi:hypothetical protein
MLRTGDLSVQESRDEGVVPECVALVLSTTVLHGQQTVTVCRP